MEIARVFIETNDKRNYSVYVNRSDNAMRTCVCVYVEQEGGHQLAINFLNYTMNGITFLSINFKEIIIFKA